MLNSTFRQLEVFLEVVETGSFAKAGERLGISQPGISRHIKALEDQCCGELLERAPGRKSELTMLGQILLEHAPGLIGEARLLSAKLGKARNEEKARPVRVTGHPYVMEHLVRPILADFTAANPEIAIEVLGLTGEVMKRRSAMTEADVAFVSVADSTEPDVEILRKVDCGLFVGRDHPLAREARITPEILRQHSFVLPLVGTPFEALLLRILGELGCGEVQAAARAQQADVIKDLTLRGIGVGHAPLQLVEAELDEGLLVRLPIAVPPLYLGQIGGARTSISSQVRALLAFARRTFGANAAAAA
ncbi:MAG TPA: LysR family transcriptional regulator [Sphingomonadaceae bacterium]|nr:LysR family transcriptional regulator [Sphingomonadaceae bacterium]